jgi:hypothetical protein
MITNVETAEKARYEIDTSLNYLQFNFIKINSYIYAKVEKPHNA